MELNVRRGLDAFVPAGAYTQLEAELRRHETELAEMPAVVLACHDPATRMLPFILYDRFIFPAGARVVAGALREAGFLRTRAVFQLWNPRFRPSRARLDGRNPELLLISTMQVHVRGAYEAVRDAWTMGDERPLIIVGGSKAFHQPYDFWPIATPRGPVGPDVVVTGEAYVLLELLNVVRQFRGRGETLRIAFERARRARALEAIPGLVYLDPEASLHEPVLVDTGLQRLVQHLDELPDETSGLCVMEPPHWGTGLARAPISDSNVRRHAAILTLQITQGCKFNCAYCPIPTLNQKTWRFRSPEGLARQIQSVRERFGIKHYFGTDDNFFNRRQTSEEILTALAATKINGRRLQGRVCLGTEATQFDTYKNRDLLPLARRAGLRAIWFGIEDLTAELINKGQKPEVTTELFSLLLEHRIMPMAMMMYHEGQPFRSRGSLYGLANQIDFLRRAGAISVQCTVHTPAVGTREYEAAFETGRVMARLGSAPVTDAHQDGCHLTMSGAEPAWRRQLKLLGGYLTFYNPLNLIRALKSDGCTVRKERIVYQLAGFLAALLTCVQLLPYLLRLAFSKPTFYQEAPPTSTVPVRTAPQAFPRFASGVTAKPRASRSASAA
jgi:radical SAM superfamily enzyme YgiQ (UPF0313 family)